jgi:hypothetical protein
MSNYSDQIRNAGLMETLWDNEHDRLEYEDECKNEGHHLVRLTDRQLWFLKCACQAKNIILPLDPRTQLSSEIFFEDYGVTQIDMEKEIKRLSVKLKAI